MLLVSRPGLVKENAVLVFHHYDIHFPLLSWCKIPNPFREYNNVLAFTFPFHIFMPLAHPSSRISTRSCPELYPLIRAPRRSLVLGRERILIPRFIRSPSTIAAHGVAHPLQLGRVDRDFSLHWAWDPKAFFKPLCYF
jgi:hypothetical protein